MGFGREDCESRVLVLGSDLVISELLDKFRSGYHFQGHRSTLFLTFNQKLRRQRKTGNRNGVKLRKLINLGENHTQDPLV
ncbi:hypothetical protein QN277_003176 [Acacia crassicarpa]|uniref:Uncharacterized protein n=1 Tax=Acacia crassicarpa TaxID=499986 RepID=A0AAE1JYQ9_9FABA|nr:hypothetical protein QN277_003176 [Acacia crassicarpa]